MTLPVPAAAARPGLHIQARGGRAHTRRGLLAGVSVSALAAAGMAAPAAAAAPRPLSQAWFAARVDASTASRAATGSATGTLNQVTTATRNLATLTMRLQQLQAVQQAAASAAAALASAVPNGLGAGGLQIAPGITAGSPGWTGAILPSQTQSAAGRVQVAVKQTQPQAVLTWQTFNVGSKTDLRFDQSAGGASASSWVVLNRVEDPAAAPSQILGSITAPGKVYLINANGIVFGAGAQVNLGGLVASTAAISDTQFAAGLYGAQSGAGFLPTFTGATPDSAIIVEPGAAIATAAPTLVTSAGGAVMLLAGTVENDGQIQTPQGQTVLAAGQDFILRAGYSTTGNQTATVLGSQVATTGADGSVTNAGLIVSDLGDVTLAGHQITQAGLVLSTTSVNTRGTVHLLNATTDTTGSITLAPGSVTSVDPDNAATTALDSQRASLVAQSTVDNALRLIAPAATNPQLDDVGTLADRLDQSRIELTTGGSVTLAGGALALSQGGQIAVQAAGRVWLADGAELDVSGSTGALLPMSSNALTVNIQGNELRDAPVNRDTGLISSNNVTIDVRKLVEVAASSADPNNRFYTAGGLLEVGGYLGNIGHTIDEWAASGGTITLSADNVIAQPQAELNVAGGSVAVASGPLAQSYLIGADGHLYNVNTAPANLRYLGVYGGFTVSYQRFGGIDVYANSLATPDRIFQAGYSYGRDAGSVIVNAPTAVLEAQIDAGVSNGGQQTRPRPAAVPDSYALPQTTVALPGTLALGGFTASGALLAPAVTFTGDNLPVAGGITATGTLPAGIDGTITLFAPHLDAAGLGGLSVITGGDITVASPLALAPGGTLDLQAATIAIGAGLTARGGRVSLTDVIANPITGATAPVLPATGGGVTIASGASIDLRGQWTNAAAPVPGPVAAEAFTGGGSFSADSARSLVLDPGVTIDVSSGGALLPGGKQAGGKGGDISLIGADPLYADAPSASNPTPNPMQVAIAATLRDAGTAGGGTLTLTAPNVVIGPPGSAVAPNTVLLTPASFQAGFSHYVIDGAAGLDVLPATVVTVAEPVYVFYGGSFGGPANAPSGADPAAVFGLVLPPTYLQDRANARLTQRQGASVALLANNRPGQPDFGGGAIAIGAAAAITVDPGQSVRIEAAGQITDDGLITARGGAVAIVNEQRETLPPPNPDGSITADRTLSVWIGDTARIDVSGLATTATDDFGRAYGLVTPGGSITLGSDGGTDGSQSRIATDARIIVSPGAVLDASGAAATIDLLAGGAPQLTAAELPAASAGPNAASVATDPVFQATSGGAITLSSYDGIDLQGAARAAPGGPGAAGGTLSMTVETPVYQFGAPVPNLLRAPHIITIAEAAPAATTPPDALAPGDLLPDAGYGAAALSQQQIDAGGFGTVALYARDAFVFQADVALHAPGSIALGQGIVTDSATAATVTVAAPIVRLTGQTDLAGEGISFAVNNAGWHPYAQPTTATFTVSADLIDIADAVRFGVSSSIAQLPAADGATPPLAVDLPGFSAVELDSTGDLRFATGSLTTPGNVTLQAAQIYPVTGAVAKVFAGYDEYDTTLTNLFLPTGTITVRAAGATPQLPYSVGGNLQLYAGAIVQGGVIRAPEGSISLGGVGVGPAGLLSGQNPANSFTSTVALLPGSVTSVSLEGQTLPYGGTVDGVTYTYNGAPAISFAPAITLAGQSQTVAAGALLDLRGGGTLSGAGFISGRGGSTNVLTTPLLGFDAATATVAAPSLASAPIYAILPGYDSAYAPTSPVEAAASYGSVPADGSQITLGAGIPGVAPGTYTLLPAYFALLPGAARVQIDTGAFDPVPGITALGAGSYQLNATTSVAHAGVHGAAPVQVVVTTSAGVGLASQFDQESYSTFQIAQAAQFGTPRGSLPEDGKTLNLIYPATPALTSALQFAGAARFDPSAGYYAGQAAVGGVTASPLALEITADGAAPTAGFTAIAASALDAIGAPRLIVGGVLQRDAALPTQLDVIGTADQVVVRDGAVLRAPEIFLAAGASGQDASSAAGSITVETGATLDTVGAGPPPFDSTAGYVYNAFGYTLVALSNGQLTFTPSTSTQIAFGPITIADGASLFTAGTLNFATDQGLSLGIAANYGARDLAIDVDNVNIVSDAALAENAAGALVLPSGFTLTQTVLSRLLAGDPATGTPPLQTLILTAGKSINFAGSVSLDTIDPATGLSTLQQFVLNTPAIYGAGAATDVASISTGTLYWNGIETPTKAGLYDSTGSALPGGVVANGPGTGLGTLDITAQTVVLGYGPNTTPDDQITLDRLIEGFATVDLQASSSLTANNRGSLGVYQSAGQVYGEPGTGGDLNITTPLLTGAAGSVDAITAGGALTLASATGASTATSGALGAELDLTAAAITDSTAILLNAGRLVMTATGAPASTPTGPAAAGNIDLAAGARIDLTGQPVALLDQTAYAGGGAVVLSAATGDITADAASSIDVSAAAAAAGSIRLTALSGAADLSGAITAHADPGQGGGSFDLRAGAVPDFDALNAALTTGGVFGARSFEIATGDLTVDQTVTAHSVAITADAGNLTVTGAIDASGAAPGSIALAAGLDLTIAAAAVLDAHGTAAQTDSTGAAIEAENRAAVALTSAAGTLTLGNATIDVRSAAATDWGQVTLTAPRRLTGATETGDVAIDATGPIDILGAQTIALYGSRTYTPNDANGTIQQHAAGAPAGAVTLDAIDADNTAFIDLAAADPGLAARTAGLSAYAAAYHLRPADTVVSSAASNNTLTVNGDLDLSTLRYGPDAASGIPGAGEAGLLTLRAAGNLVVNGSITDGFAAPPDAAINTPDDKGWVLYGNEPVGQAVTLPQDLATPVLVTTGTSFATANVTLNYAITIAATTLNANVVIPGNVVTAKDATIPAGGITATGTITDPTGAPIARPGQILAANTLIPAGSTLGQGTVLPFTIKLADQTVWPAGANLDAFSSQSVKLSLPGKTTLALSGGAFIPVGTKLVFATKGATTVNLRATTDGVQGLIYATAALLPPGSQSWSFNLVGGADLASADLLAVQPITALAAAPPPGGIDPAGSVVLNDTHYTLANSKAPTASFSVVRTGTGSLNVAAGGNVDESSLFGLYTAGTQTSLGPSQDPAFQTGRTTQADGTVLGVKYDPTYGAVIAGQQAAYPDHGGDVLVAAQNDVLGDIVSGQAGSPGEGSDNVGDWLWRQGGAGLGQSTAWSINFGSYVLPLDANGNVVNGSKAQPVLAGFTGIGALGGGNVAVQAGNDAGEVDPITSVNAPVSQGLVIAVASTGRVTSVAGAPGAVTGGATALTGGGDLTVDVGGTLNPAQLQLSSGTTLGGTLTDLRGDISVDAGQVGRIDLVYNAPNPTDPRPQDPFSTQFAVSSNGLIVVPGDGAVSIDAMRDLVLAGAGDPGRQPEQALTAIDPLYLPPPFATVYGGNTGFSLWTGATAINLFSAGGNLTPTTAAAQGLPGQIANDAPTDYRFVYPATLSAVAASGSMFYGANGILTPADAGYSLELAPSATGQLSLLAAGSIYGHGYAIDMSGADAGLNATPNPYNPAYTDQGSNPFAPGVVNNLLDAAGNVPSPDALFAFQADTPTTNLHASDPLPARIYAATGDLVDVQFGEILNFLLADNETPGTWYLAAKPAWMMAGRDIVGNGTRPAIDQNGYAAAAFTTTPNQRSTTNAISSGSLLLNLAPTDVSVVSAGRDLLGSYVYVAGPGLLEVNAGRNIVQTGDNGLAFGVLKSLGPIIGATAASRSGGASIAVLAGAGAAGLNDAAFAAQYFDPANQADLSIPLSDPANAGKVQQTYQDALYAWLQAGYGYTGTSANALAFFDALPATQRDVFVRSVFFDELVASGRQESDPDSLFFKSYARGRTAIATLFPTQDAAGAPIAYNGALTMDSGTLASVTDSAGRPVTFDSGISTLLGGDIQILSPGGGDVFGTAGGPVPGASSGVITYGSGDIDIYALESVLLGQSRVFTTFGGNIAIWSAQGDINAGRGAKTTTISQPPLIAYDPYGGIILSPDAPTSGAGIATLAPIAGIVAGDVDLIAPLGTVDAGEAGIRVSGNLNISALTVLNAANVQVGGKTTGSTAAVATNTAAATAAATAAGASVDAANNSTTQRTQQAAQSPSVITVEILDPGNDDQRRRPAA